MPATSLVREAVVHNLKVDLLMYYVVSYVAFKFFTKKRAISEEEDKEGKKSKTWANLRFYGELPGWGTQIVKVMLAYLGYDAMFYWSHRLLHQKAFYLPVHKFHHRFHTPVGM